MARRKLGFDDVRKMALALPDVEDGTTWGTPALKARGKLLACIPSHRSAEPDSVAVCIDFATRDELLAAEPETYYVKPHYENYKVVLVRLAKIHPDALRDLIAESWQFVTTKKPRPRRRPR